MCRHEEESYLTLTLLFMMTASSKKEDILMLTDVFRSVLVPYVDPFPILMKSSLRFSLGHRSGEIFDTSKNSKQKGMEMMLNAIEEMEDQTGIYRQFMDGLKLSGYCYLHDKIIGRHDNEERWELYKILLRTRQDFMQVNPVEMICHLPDLSGTDCEAIRSTTNRHGNTVGACELFLRLEAYGPDTLKQIIDGLRKIGHCELAQSLEILEEKDDDKNGDSTAGGGGGGGDDNNRKSDNGNLPQEGNNSEHDRPSQTGNNCGDSGHSPGATSRDDGGVTGNANPMKDIVAMLQMSSSPESCSGESDTACTTRNLQSVQAPDLYDYQEELAESAIQGKNTIIVAPTGSGKTRVAIAIAMHTIQENQGASKRPPKVIFVVNKVALVEQQKAAFQAFVGDSVVGISGDMSSQVPLVEHVRQSSVIVLTAQILVNALQEGTFSLSQVGLLIMDECHNTQKLSAYNTIMAMYRDRKESQSEEVLPQVVGLTASLGVGKSKSQWQAVEHVLKLCANLDADDISTVRRFKDSLETKYHKPHEETFAVSGRNSNDPFKRLLEGLMERIETVIFKSQAKDILKSNRDMKDLSSHRGSQQYEGEVTKLKRYVTVNIQDAKQSRQLQECVEFLEVYNQSLYINRDTRTKDAVNRIRAHISLLKEKGQDVAGNCLSVLIKMFEAENERLDTICTDPTNENPVLQKLEEVLRTQYAENSETLTILFTNTRASTSALQAWIEESEALHKFSLNPGTLIGTGREGMTQPQQEKLLAMFKEKKHKVVISTSVAEEGLDIQMCNLVVRYNYVRDDIGRVQARGRSRAKDGKFYLVFNKNLPNLADRERMNKIRESMMQKATETVCKMIQDNKKEYTDEIISLQKKDSAERSLKMSGLVASKKRNANKSNKNDMSLICKGCRKFACFADDIRCINEQHHIVKTEEFLERVKFHEIEETILYGDITTTKKILCLNCYRPLGYSIIYMGHELPLLSIKFLVIENSKGMRYYAKKWKDVPFLVKPIDLLELSQRLGNKEEPDTESNVEKDPE